MSLGVALLALYFGHVLLRGRVRPRLPLLQLGAVVGKELEVFFHFASKEFDFLIHFRKLSSSASYFTISASLLLSTGTNTVAVETCIREELTRQILFIGFVEFTEEFVSFAHWHQVIHLGVERSFGTKSLAREASYAFVLSLFLVHC